MSEQLLPEDIWDKLQEFKQVKSDGMFYCRNKDGRKVILLYSEADKIFMTCDTNDCDLGNEDNFKDRH